MLEAGVWSMSAKRDTRLFGAKISQSKKGGRGGGGSAPFRTFKYRLLWARF